MTIFLTIAEIEKIPVYSITSHYSKAEDAAIVLATSGVLPAAAIVAGSTAAVGTTSCGLFAVSRYEYHRAGRIAKAEDSEAPAAPSAPGVAATAAEG